MSEIYNIIEHSRRTARSVGHRTHWNLLTYYAAVRTASLLT